MTVSVVIATYGREGVLIETIGRLRALDRPPDEIVVVDQTPRHEPEVDAGLRALHDSGQIVWRRRSVPSIPGAMNEGLLIARSKTVLFVDDDVVPLSELIEAHEMAQLERPQRLVAGQVLQPGQQPAALVGDEFEFRSTVRQSATEFIGCNFSVPRQAALEAGGFDECFVGAAYRYERDFSLRWRAAGGEILFDPAANLSHLRAPSGGTRAIGVAGRTWNSGHSVGEYYFLLRHRPAGTWRSILRRPFDEIMSRHHLRRPWWIPVTFAVELAGLLRAARLTRRPARLLDASVEGTVG